eukprot:TRINITY_DN9075_c0_g1_i1.p1 TRINITY_DN9075_c0_g1~~TRINITY_DN9075_c0_g1_i1.p1  ORF type:complete len:305 (-),score=40.59 TRINITY_DN9075_c0_g1_i1:60-974(-)
MALPPLPTVRELIRLYGLTARQQLSQNFLLDLNITDKIARATGRLTNKVVLEVGAGPGSLTRSILRHDARHVVAVEKDKRFLNPLEILSASSPGKISIHLADILELDEQTVLEGKAERTPWEEPDCRTVIMGNLPFSVSTPLLIKWIKSISNRIGPFVFGRSPMILLFQKEVATRIVAKPSTKAYGRLSVMTQHLCDARLLFDIPSKAFVPSPKVDASVVLIVPKIKPLVPVSVNTLEYVCRKGFSYRRKQLSNSLCTIHPQAGDLLAKLDIRPSLRAEDLTVEQWCNLANTFDAWEFKGESLP